MKKILSFLSVALLVFSFSSTVALAKENQSPNLQQSVEHLSNGGYFVTTIESDVPDYSSRLSRASSSKSGSKTATYYNSKNVAQWSIKVTGKFTYTGSSSSATSSSKTLTYYVSGCSSSSNSAYTSGKSAIAYATVKCAGLSTYKSVTLSCSANGTLS